MYSNQYTPQYSQYNQQYQQYPSNYYQMYNNYNQPPAYNVPPPTQTATTFISPNAPAVQQPQVSTPGQNVTSLWMGSVSEIIYNLYSLTIMYYYSSWNLI